MAGGRWWLTTDSVDVVIRETPERLYEMVSDLPRMGEPRVRALRMDRRVDRAA